MLEDLIFKTCKYCQTYVEKSSHSNKNDEIVRLYKWILIVIMDAFPYLHVFGMTLLTASMTMSNTTTVSCWSWISLARCSHVTQVRAVFCTASGVWQGRHVNTCCNRWPGFQYLRKQNPKSRWSRGGMEIQNKSGKLRQQLNWKCRTSGSLFRRRVFPPSVGKVIGQEPDLSTNQRSVRHFLTLRTSLLHWTSWLKTTKQTRWAT